MLKGMTQSLHWKQLACWGSLVFMMAAGPAARALEPATAPPRLIEVFTASDLPPTPRDSTRAHVEMRVYELDGIARFEARLSANLPGGPGSSRNIALQRVRQVNETDRARMRHAAVGLARAAHYAIDRYPAMVFDGQVAVYGLTDVAAALGHYRAWRAANPP